MTTYGQTDDEAAPTVRVQGLAMPEPNKLFLRLPDAPEQGNVAWYLGRFVVYHGGGWHVLQRVEFDGAGNVIGVVC